MNDGDVERIVTETISKFGQLDLLVSLRLLVKYSNNRHGNISVLDDYIYTDLEIYTLHVNAIGG